MRNRWALVSTVLAFLSGGLTGALAFAVLGPYRSELPPEVQGAALVVVGAIIAAFWAMMGAWLGGTTAAAGAREAAATAASGAAQRATGDEVRRLGTVIVTAGTRHWQMIADQVSAREEAVGKPFDTPLPTITATTAIEEAIPQLYTLGRRGQLPGDIATAYFDLLLDLEQFAYSPRRHASGGSIRAMSPDEAAAYLVAAEAARLIRTTLMSAVAEAAGGEPLDREPPRDPADYATEYRARAEAGIREGLARGVSIQGSTKTQP